MPHCKTDGFQYASTWIGKDYDDLSDRQQRERRKQIKDHVKSQLCQLNKIGLEPVSLTLQSDSQEILININEKNAIRTEVKEDRKKIAPDMLYLLLQYGISQESYHEIAMRCPNLPRLHQVCKT